VDTCLQDALRALDEARDERLDATPVVLGTEYLLWVEAVEALSKNQSGADKTWVRTARQTFRSMLSGVRRAR